MANLQVSVISALCLMVVVVSVTADSGCYWSGTAPFCSGSCRAGEYVVKGSHTGDGSSCVTGKKKYCCKIGFVPSPKPSVIVVQQQKPKPAVIVVQQQTPKPQPSIIVVQQKKLKPAPVIVVQQQKPKPQPSIIVVQQQQQQKPKNVVVQVVSG